MLTKSGVWGLVLAVWAFLGCEQIKPVLQLTPSPVSPERLQAQVKEVLEESLASGDAEFRSHSLECYGLLRNDLSVPGHIRQGLRDVEIAVRFAAAVAAGDVQDSTSQILLERLMRDPEASVRMAAAYGLERLGEPRSETWYDKALLGEDENLAALACLLLGKLGDDPPRQRSRQKLWEVMEKEGQSPKVRLQAAESLARLGDESVLNKLLVFAHSGWADDRMLAISGMALLDAPEARGMLAGLADDDQTEVRLAAIRALGPLADDEQRALVVALLSYRNSDGDELASRRVRGLALLALGSIGAQSHSGRLDRALNDPSPYLRIMAARAAIDLLQRQQAITSTARM